MRGGSDGALLPRRRRCGLFSPSCAFAFFFFPPTFRKTHDASPKKTIHWKKNETKKQRRLFRLCCAPWARCSPRPPRRFFQEERQQPRSSPRPSCRPRRGGEEGLLQRRAPREYLLLPLIPCLSKTLFVERRSLWKGKKRFHCLTSFPNNTKNQKNLDSCRRARR